MEELLKVLELLSDIFVSKGRCPSQRTTGQLTKTIILGVFFFGFLFWEGHFQLLPKGAVGFSLMIVTEKGEEEGAIPTHY